MGVRPQVQQFELDGVLDFAPANFGIVIGMKDHLPENQSIPTREILLR
jgi:hypothetical protein